MNSYNIINSNIHTCPVIISIPSSGTFIPPNLKKNIDKTTLLTDVSWYLQELFAFLKPLEITIIQNNTHPCLMNLNISSKENLNLQKTHYNRKIYEIPPKLRQLTKNIDKYYTPYYSALDNLIEEKLKHYPRICFVNIVSENETNQPLKTSTSKSISDYVDFFPTNYTSRIMKGCLHAEGYAATFLDETKENKIITHINRLYGPLVQCVNLRFFYNDYIEERAFAEEEFPLINTSLFFGAQQRFMRVFEKFSFELKQQAFCEYLFQFPYSK